ncbi:MAG: hypothetical protein H6739_28275 [Alphaproteobacteria bacterium]|nr:hypothetical protein [Alphaproteobacteria bacterium]
MDVHALLALVQGACADFEPVLDVTLHPEGEVCVRVRDLLPDTDPDPWELYVRWTEDFAHPLFGERYPCVELALAVLATDPAHPDYHDVIAAYSAPVLDHQRYVFGPSVGWDVDGGQLTAYAQVRDRGQGQALLGAELRDQLRSMVALIYLISFRVWQIEVRRRHPDGVRDVVVEAIWASLLQSLGGAPEL